MRKYFTRSESSVNLGNTVIVLVGVGKKEKKNLPHNIIALERTNGARELAAIYQAADVYVNATLEDNFPTTNIEALACGTPVITFATGGSTEAVDETCGLVTEEKSAKGIYKALLQTKKTPFDRKKCAQKGREYDKKIRFSQYIDLYNKIRKTGE